MRETLRRVAPGLAVAIAISGCSESSPMEAGEGSEPVRFSLSQAQAEAFQLAMADVRDRIQPGLAETADDGLGPVLSELSQSIETRDQYALARAIVSAQSALAAFEQADAETGALANDLDALRLILEHARPLLESRIQNQ